MRIPDETRDQLAVKFAVLFPHLDERQRRLLAAAEARSLGHGGIRAVARAARVSETTIRRGMSDLEAGEPLVEHVRRPGGGRKRVADLDPGLRSALLGLVEPDERGDPMSPLRWTTKSTRTLAAELTRQGRRVGADTVAGLLRQEGFRLQANAKMLEGSQHADRDAQFRYLNEQARDHRDAGQPVISVDTKKKELVGDFHNPGRSWRPTGDPVPVRVHDFADPQLGKAIPYGIYDLAANTGWINVGTDHDTAAFAVESIRCWWHDQGRAAYPRASRLLITADAGGSNGYRTRAWKLHLARLAAETGLTITVCHLPPGTSKWNKIEHRLFSHITMNWRGRPLTSHEVILQSITATTTRTGLRVKARAGHQHLSHRHGRRRRGDGGSATDPAHLPRRVELCPAPPADPSHPGSPKQPAIGAAVGPGHAVRSRTDRPDPAPAAAPHRNPGRKRRHPPRPPAPPHLR